MSARGVRRFVADLLRGRATKPFHAEEADVAELRTAIALRAARAGSGAPSEEFLSGLHRRLAGQLSDAGAHGNSASGSGGSRRRFIQGASIAASAATIGAVAGHTLAGNADRLPGQDTPPGATLSPITGVWRTVAASDEVGDGSVRAFDLGGVAGFVHRSSGGLAAVSGTCTHQGCLLRLNAPARRLDCPCHNSAFAVTGELLFHQLPVPPRDLPQLSVRELDGAIQVFAPPAAG